MAVIVAGGFAVAAFGPWSEFFGYISCSGYVVRDGGPGMEGFEEKGAMVVGNPATSVIQ